MKLEQSTPDQIKAAVDHETQLPPSRLRWIALLALIAAIAIVVIGILLRISASDTLAKETREMAIASVSVVQPKNTAPTREVVLPANVQAYMDSPIYARTNGYLKRWYVDIGSHVKAGQLLAEIDTPEVNQQLRQALADKATAEANGHLAEITSQRYAGLLQSDSVSKQEADNAASDYEAKKAIVQSANANVRRLEDWQSFQRIYAPFDGVITARNTDVGALIDSGSAGGVRTELFHLAQPGKLRVYVNVPQAYSQATKPGLTADLTLQEFPGRTFQGKLVRTANAIDPSTRTLLVEIAVNNPTGELLTGSFAEVHLKLAGAQSAVIVPVNTLLFRKEGLQVVLVASNRAELRPITIGHDFGSEVEVISGLTGGENVVVNPPDSIESGEELRIVSQPGGNGQ